MLFQRLFSGIYAWGEVHVERGWGVFVYDNTAYRAYRYFVASVFRNIDVVWDN